jgi:tetratricopeptide (TPR) repeat protein
LNPAPRPLYWLAATLHLVCPLLFFTDLTRNPYVTQISLLQGGLWLAAAGFAAWTLRRREYAAVETGLEAPLLAFFGWGMVTWALSWLDHPPFRQPVWNEGRRLTLFFVSNGLLVYWLAAQLRDPDWTRRFRRLVLAVGATASVYGLMQYFGRDPIWPTVLNPYAGRPVSTFGNPNFLSSYLVMLLPAALLESARARTALGTAASGGAFLALSAALLATMTRSSWIGGLAAVASFLWFARAELAARRRRLALLLAGALALAAFWPTSSLADRPQRPVDRVRELIGGIAGEKVYGSWHQRLMIWSCAWDMVRERPVAGKGWGTFELFYPFYQGAYLSDKVFRSFRTHANNAHNVVLEFWAQTGTVGLGLFLWVCLLGYVFARRRLPGLPEDARAEGWSLLAGGAGMLADNFFGNVSLFFAVPALLFFWQQGALGALAARDRVRVRPLRAAGAAAAVLTVAAGLAGARTAYAHWRAEVAYFEGFKKAKQNDMKEAIARTEESRRFRRWEVNNNYELANAYARQARWAAEKGLTQESRAFLEKALGAYDEAIAANAGYDEIYYNRGAVLAQLGRAEEAVRSYRTALLINPLSLEATKALGNAYLQESRFADAEALFGRAVLHFPRDKDLWNNLGYVRTRQEKHEAALEAYERALRLDFQFATAAKNLQVGVAKLGRKDHPLYRVPELWDRMRRSAAAGDWAGAAKASESLKDLAPENVDARLWRGDILAQTGDLAGAEAEYRALLALEPAHRSARVNLAKVVLQRGDRPAAVAMLRGLAAEGDKAAEEALNSLGESPAPPPSVE